MTNRGNIDVYTLFSTRSLQYSHHDKCTADSLATEGQCNLLKLVFPLLAQYLNVINKIIDSMKK